MHTSPERSASPALAALDEGLQTFRAGLSVTGEWLPARTMGEALAELRERHRDAARAADPRRIAMAVEDYLLTGMVMQRDEIYTLCLGAGLIDADGKCILADRELRERLFTFAETITGRSRRLRAFRNLLHTYWSFPRHDETTPPAAVSGWLALRDWLNERYAAFARHPARKPGWFNALGQHRHLLGEQPCAPYAATSVAGRFETLQHAMDCLHIPRHSWLKIEAVMAQIDAAAALPDDDFDLALPALIELTAGRAGIEVPGTMARRAVAGLVVRYAARRVYQAHPGLFGLAVELLGTPWRDRAGWDALVCDVDGNPSSLAREMVADWLKERLLGEFFGDGGRPGSRGEMWLRYSVFMQEISRLHPWREEGGEALLLRIGDFLLIVPRGVQQPVQLYPWQAFFTAGGTRLLESGDGAQVEALLAQRKPLQQAAQAPAGILKLCEFAISTKAHLLAHG